jgi:hypothetical protein
MNKVSIRPEGHNRKAAGRNHYEALRRPDLERHPVDTAVEARLFHRAVRRRVIQLQERIKSALGNDVQPLLQLDALLNDERAEREEAYFNVGYEYGAVESTTRRGVADADGWLVEAGLQLPARAELRWGPKDARRSEDLPDPLFFDPP